MFMSLFLLLINHNSFSQTGLYEDFSSPTGTWLDEDANNYTVVTENGVNTIEVDKQAPWQSISYDLAGTYNLNDNPYASFKIKSEIPFQFHLYLKSGNRNVLRTVRVYPSDEWVEYFIDFSDYGNLDITAVDQLIVAANGTSIGWDGTFMFDDLRLGDQVTKMANLTGVADQAYGAAQMNNIIRVKDVQNAHSVTFTGGSTVIENISVSPIINGLVTITFDTKDVSATENITITANANPGFTDNSTSFDLSVSQNTPPTLDGNISTLEAGVGEETTIMLTGITDGNPESHQSVSVAAVSDDQTAIPDNNITVDYDDGESIAYLHITPAGAAMGTTITVTVTDDGESPNATSETFLVNSYTNFNKFPTIDMISDQQVNIDEGLQTIPLTGISDGNGGTQTLTFTATSDNPTVLPNDSIRVVNHTGSTAELEFYAVESGLATITLEVADDGAGTDNGPLSVDQTFDMNFFSPLPTGKVVDMSGNIQDDLTDGLWTLHDGQGGKFTVSYVDSGSFNALKVETNDKFLWDGYNLILEADTAIDMSNDLYVSMEIYSVDEATLHWIWFYDNTDTRNDNVNTSDSHRFWAPAGEWTDIRFDYSGEDDMLNKNIGEPINTSNIVRILFNMHNAAPGWPTPANYNGTFFIRNLRIGSEALRPEFTPTITIDPVSNLVLYDDAGLQEITLTGITDGGDGSETPVVTATSSNNAFISAPTVTAVSGNEATLSFTPAALADTATITLTVNAPNSNPTEISFMVSSFTDATTDAGSIAVDISDKHQMIHGFGTYQNQPSLSDYYVEEMGGSAMRIGLINSQLEVVNDNDDPYSLDRSKLNMNAFDWDYFRDLHERGVETFILTSWSPPAWMKQNLATDWQRAQAPDYNQTNNQLEEYYYEEFAESMVAAVRVFKEQSGIEIKAIGPQNEPAFNEPYPSAILSPEYFARLVAVIGKRFEQEGMNTKIFMPEQVFSQGHYSMAEYMDAVQANPDAYKYTDIIAVHGYASDGVGSGTPDFSQWTAMYNNAQEGEMPKELWMTETFKGYESYEDAMWIAIALYGSLEYGNISLWTQWAFNGQHITNARPNQMLYACSNYFKYIRPGAQRVTTVSSNDDLLASSYVHEEDGRFTTVVVNDGHQAYKAYVTGDNLPSKYHVIRTSEFESAVDLGMSTDSVILFPPRSVTTLTAVGNMAPSIDQVQDMTVMMDAAQQDVILTGITYGDDPIMQNVTSVTATSSNTDLIPNPTVGSLSGESATLSFTPVAGQSGTATIHVTVQDDGTGFGFNTTTMSFEVAVYGSINEMPAFNRVPDFFTQEDAGEQTITVSGLTDGDSETQNLTIDATTTNGDLIPGFTITQNSGSADVSFTTPEDYYGEAIVKLTVTDDGGTGDNNGDQSYDQNFMVFVAPVNDAPTIDPVEKDTTGMNAGEQTIQLTGLSDGEDYGASQALQVYAISSDPTLIKNPSVVYGGGSTATLYYLPEPDQQGTATITVKVMDDGGLANGGTDSTSITFDIEVVPTNVNNAPTINTVADKEVFLEDATLSFNIEGVTDGDDGTQDLTIEATSSDPDVVGNPTVNYVSSLDIVSLNMFLNSLGTATITVTVTDDGGTEFGGVDQTQITFDVVVKEPVGVSGLTVTTIKAYPNPAADRIHVELPANHTFTEYFLLDPSGKIMLKKNVNGRESLDIKVNHLSAGDYILMLKGKSKISRINIFVEKK